MAGFLVMTKRKKFISHCTAQRATYEMRVEILGAYRFQTVITRDVVSARRTAGVGRTVFVRHILRMARKG